MKRHEMMDIEEIQRRTAMSTAAIAAAIARRKFPTPVVGELKGVPLWWREEVENWLQTRWVARC